MKEFAYNILKRKDLEGFISIKKLHLEGEIYIVDLKNKYIIAKRTGKCDYKKCKNVCCKFISLTYPHEYFEGFGKPTPELNHIVIKKTCKFLDKCGTCKKWGKKNFPRACEQFPHLSDGLFIEIMDKCTFKYEVIYEIEKNSEKIREEMLLNFKVFNKICYKK